MKKWLIATAVLGISLILFISLRGNRESASSNKPEFAKVQKGNLLISLKESGYLNAVKEEMITNSISLREVNIIDIIPDGTFVQKGDFLIEFDSEPLLQEKVKFEVQVSERQLSLTDAETGLEITESQVQSDVALAQNSIEVANINLEKFTKLEKEKLLNEALADINIAEDQYKFSEQTYQSSVELEGKGFETKSKVEQDKLALAAKDKQLQAAKTKHEMLVHYDLKQQELRLTKEAEEAFNKHERTKKQGENKMQKALALLESSKRKLELAEEELADINDQLKLAKITSPVTGYALYPQVKYYQDNLKIEKGKSVRRKQTVMRIPDMRAMKVDIDIAEHYISDVKVGQSAFITIDSIKDQQFPGKVGNVALMPTETRSWGSTGVQKYDVVIDIEQGLLPEDIKPQITASVEIILDELEDVLYIPIQSLHTVKGKRVVYLKKQGSNDYQEHEVTLGKMNNSFVEVLSGLDSKDQILISEPVL
ncbi:MAG: efflux RND transporter periplasmic adaptor subunit [Akkermansiaceae bacterium]